MLLPIKSRKDLFHVGEHIFLLCWMIFHSLLAPFDVSPRVSSCVFVSVGKSIIHARCDQSAPHFVSQQCLLLSRSLSPVYSCMRSPSHFMKAAIWSLNRWLDFDSQLFSYRWVCGLNRNSLRKSKLFNIVRILSIFLYVNPVSCMWQIMWRRSSLNMRFRPNFSFAHIY